MSYKRYVPIIMFLLMFIVSCSVNKRYIITDIGYEPEEVEESMIYALPKTSLKVSLSFSREIFIPGPYADYALKQLGIENVKKMREENYTVKNISVDVMQEPDAGHIYSLNMLDGSFDIPQFQWAESNKLILVGDFNQRLLLNQPGSLSEPGSMQYLDVTMEPNTELHEETIYKTILTDTSFVRVPVTSQQMERKTREKKAEEAAKLILEIRGDRYFLAAGLIDPFPQAFDMKTALNGLDDLENEYLSLFIGKTFVQEFHSEYYITPEGSLETESFDLTRFSSTTGLSDSEGDRLFIQIEPSGNLKSLRNILPQKPEEEVFNRFYYRIPDLTTVSVSLGAKVLLEEKISIFQSGALVSILSKEKNGGIWEQP